MEVTDIGNKEEGKLWHRKPTTGKRIVRTSKNSKCVKFLHVAFDGGGGSFLAGDHHGNVYVFDICRNRFHLVQRTEQACTALAFNLHRSNEFLVALADGSVKCFDKDTKQMVSWLQGHEGAVSSISTHSSAHSAITTSSDVAQIWDLDTFERTRKLSVKQPVSIQKVFYVPNSNTILSSFSDGSIFAWDSDSLSCKYQLPFPDTGPKVSYKTLAVTLDSKVLAAGGRSNVLHLWCLESRQLLKVIQMPEQVRTVKQLEFLPENVDNGATRTLGVLSQDGLMRFVDINSCKLRFHIGSPDTAIDSVALSPNGRHVVAVLSNGSISVHDIHHVTQISQKVDVLSDAQESQKCSKLQVRPRLTKPSGSTVQNDFPVGLDKKRLVTLLKEFGEYPAKYRTFVWRSLLSLPDNCAAYSTLTDKGLHPAFVSLHEKYPIKSQKLQRGLHRVLSALAHWASIFGEIEYLPLVAFPFVKLFQNNPMLCFEVLASVIVNWCQHWFEYFPNPPLNILSMTENVLAHHDPKLLRHLLNCNVTSQLYVWPLLETLFSEVLTRGEWLRLFDHVFSNHPSFLLISCVAYVTCCRGHLLLCFQKQDFEYFFHHRNNLDLSAVIKEAHRLMNNTPDQIHPRTMLDDLTPLTHGEYPIFNHYPEFIVEYRSQERKKFQQQETEYLREKQDVSTLQSNLVRRQAERKAFSTQQVDNSEASQKSKLSMKQELLLKAEEQRRNLLALEEEKLSEQTSRLADMKRELQAEELQLLEATKKSLLKHRELRASQMKRLDQENRRKAQEESLVNACQQGSESDLQRETTPHLHDNEARRETPVERLAELLRTTVSEQDVAGQKWEDVMSARAQLQERRPTQTSLNQQSVTPPHAHSGFPASHRPPVPCTAATDTTKMVCLNSSPSESSCSSFLSLDRDRAQLDCSERRLLKEIRELRQKLAARARDESSTSSQ